MSTFGKRALKKWDYNGDMFQANRFNKSPKEIQLAILEKWYPIGMTCLRKDHAGFWQEGYTITGYSEQLTYYSVETRREWLIVNMKSVQDGTFPPLVLKPDENWLKVQRREYKLNQLGINESEPRKL